MKPTVVAKYEFPLFYVIVRKCPLEGIYVTSLVGSFGWQETFGANAARSVQIVCPEIDGGSIAGNNEKKKQQETGSCFIY